MMFKKSIAFISLSWCILFVQTLYAETIVNFVDGGLDVAAFQFDILAPSADFLDATDFNASWPDGWNDFSIGDIINAFDGTGSASLPTGQVGYFDDDGVVLGNWVVGNQEAEALIEGVDYFVSRVGNTYTISASTPLPTPSAVPTVSEWGMIFFFIFLVGLGSWLVRRGGSGTSIRN